MFISVFFYSSHEFCLPEIDTRWNETVTDSESRSFKQCGHARVDEFLIT